MQFNLVKELGERYLWVDALSVTQDRDKDSMDCMLRAMAYMYASAEFTIVAAHGSDANYGLRGIGGPSQPRQPTDPPLPESYSTSKPDSSCPFKSIWASRG